VLSLCFNHVATVASLFRSSVIHFLAKLSKICEIFFSCEKKTMKLSLLHKNVNASSHIKDNLMALTARAVYQFELWLKVQDMPSKLSLPRQGPWKLVWVEQVFELSEIEFTEFHCKCMLPEILVWSRSKCCEVKGHTSAVSFICSADASPRSLSFLSSSSFIVLMLVVISVILASAFLNCYKEMESDVEERTTTWQQK